MQRPCVSCPGDARQYAKILGQTIQFGLTAIVIHQGLTYLFTTAVEGDAFVPAEDVRGSWLRCTNRQDAMQPMEHTSTAAMPTPASQA